MPADLPDLVRPAGSGQLGGDLAPVLGEDSCTFTLMSSWSAERPRDGLDHPIGHALAAELHDGLDLP